MLAKNKTATHEVRVGRFFILEQYREPSFIPFSAFIMVKDWRI